MIAAPLMSLEEWREAAGWEPWHFWQWVGALAPVESACSDVVHEFAWQSGGVAGRYDIVEALVAAEAELARLLGFHIAPKERTERHVYDRSGAIVLDRGYVEAVGRVVDNRVADGDVAYEDRDGDGLPEFARVVVPADVEAGDVGDIYLRAIEADRDISQLNNRRIIPMQAVVDSEELTVVARGWQFGKPRLLTRRDGTTLDPEIASNYMVQASVYRREVVDRGVGWLYKPDGSCGTCCGERKPHQLCVQIVDSTLGVVVVDGGCELCGYRGWGEVEISYVSGYPREYGAVASPLRRVVAALVAARLGGTICGCELAASNRLLKEWQEVPTAKVDGRLRQGENPLGIRRGEVMAWSGVREMQMVKGIWV